MHLLCIYRIQSIAVCCKAYTQYRLDETYQENFFDLISAILFFPDFTAVVTLACDKEIYKKMIYTNSTKHNVLI